MTTNPPGPTGPGPTGPGATDAGTTGATDAGTTDAGPAGPGPRPDTRARARIATSLDETLFVEAGAGSGKTRALVERIGALVTTGAARLSEVAAITFTEKAAAELRDRLRRQLDAEHDRAFRTGDQLAAERTATALDELDGAAIGTLHSFAQRILTEHPIDVGLPPRIEVLDEVASAVAFDDRWSSFVDELLADPAVERSLLLATAAGVRISALRLVAVAFNENWDLVVDHGPTLTAEPPDWQERLEVLLDQLDGVCAEGEHCQDESDRLLDTLTRLQEWGRRVRAAGDEYTRLSLLGVDGGRPREKANGRGAKTKWANGHDLPGLRSRIDAITSGCESLRNEVALAAVTRLAVELRRFTLDAAEERRAAGELEFHDLLVLARQMLRSPGSPESGTRVRRALHERYRRLLIDEFQDTDPIQIELAVLIASDDPDAGAKRWDDIEPAPGHLFFVGDPKQSIYRFRRADISLFLRAADRFGADDRRLALTTNHRAGSPIIDAVNHVFGRLIEHGERGGLPSQPAYEPFVAARDEPPAGPAVSVLGRDAHDDAPRAAELRTRESAEVAATVLRALREGWQVDRSADWTAPDWQPARAGDVTILVPTRTVLPALEDALSAAGIAYRAESASLVYASRLVRDVLLTLRAIDDPTDELSVVSALRSPLFACGDDDLLVYRRQHDGRFDHGRPLPEDMPPDHPVARGVTYLREMHETRLWRTPSELIDRVVRDRRVMELGAAEGRARDLWRRVRFVIDQARAWSETTDGTLRQYLAWIRQQTGDGARVAEAVLPETDDDAVRIMTVHAAKGLQFPFTIVTGMSTRPYRRAAEAEVAWPPGEPCIIRIGKKVTSEAFEAWKPVDEQMSHDERIRLLYVASTRARDHLVLSLHRSVRAYPVDDQARLTSAELLAEAAGELLEQLPDGPDAADTERLLADPFADPLLPAVGPMPAAGRPTLAVVPDPPAPPDPIDAVGRLATGGTAGPERGGASARQVDDLVAFDEWRRIRDESLAASGRPRTLSATALTDDGSPDVAGDPGLHKRPRDLDLPPWQKGRYGTAVGRAVHGVLQTIDLATGAGLAEAVAAQAAAEAVVGHEADVRTLVEAALRSPSVVGAAARPHWRELYVGVPLPDARVLEGYVDLLYRSDGGLVVVDYKTGPATTGDDLDALVERYSTQGASYALAVGEATGEPVVDVVFAFLTPEGPVERSLPDLATAVAHVRRLAESGDPRLTAVG
jgi:ATP-dependent exoDNAse (exonuclease V) beta subunit